MKKLFTFALLALLCTTVASAQRKTWDFTKGFSTTTIENLRAAGWTDETPDQSLQCNARSAGPLVVKVDGADWEVPETSGLYFYNTAAKHIVFAYNRTSGGFVGTKYLWINGKNNYDAIHIPAVPAGEKVTIVYESHSKTEARGFTVSGNFSDAIGNTRFTSNDRLDTVVVFNNGDSEADLKLNSTSGHHIYSIVIGDGDPVVEQKIAYLYAGETDAVLGQLQARESSTVEAIDVTEKGDITAEALRAYSLVVLAANIPADNWIVPVVKEALPYTPFLNMNADLYGAWTYGVAVPMETPIGLISDFKSLLLKDVEYYTEGDEEDQISYIDLGEGAKGITLGDYFAGDETPLVSLDGESTVAHIHNIGHNGYIYFPYGELEAAQKVISNAVEMLLESKAEVTAAPAPGIVVEYKNLNTNIRLTCSKSLQKAHIYYTLDGSDPTEKSTEYTDVINVTQPCTIKAVAIGEGYLLSSIATQVVEIKEQPKTPVISYVQEDGKTTVTITCESANDDTPVYFNTSGSTKANQSVKYTEPFTISMPQDIYAYAVASEAVWSEIAHERILVKNPHVAVDIVGHFATGSNWVKVDGENTTTLGNNGSLFSANTKDATSMYKEDGAVETIIDDEGNEIEIKEEVDYKYFDEPGEDPQWTVVTKGQVVLWQNNDPTSTQVIGDNNAGVYPVSSLDIDSIFAPTKNNICFYTCFTGEKPNAAIQSKGKFAGPFDIVTIANLATGAIILQVSTDGNNWIQVGDTIQKTGYSRLWKKYTASYTGNDEVYVRAAQPDNGASGPKIYDIYIAKEGEQSAELLAKLNEEYNTGIQTLTDPKARVAAGIYNVNGVRRTTLQRGLNIVIYGDGTVKKVIVK